MRLRLAVLGLLLAIFSDVAISEKTYAQEVVSVNLFYQELSQYGGWHPHVEFGFVWQPYGVGPEWRPYTDGRWEWSDRGWIWISYEPWGWATYHYGRWVYDDYQGWIWIPGTTWAPAYVTWHQTPQYIGWSPLPPDRSFFLEIGFFFNFYNTNYYEPYYKKHRHKHRYYHDYYHNPHHYTPPATNCVFMPYKEFANHKQALRAAAPPENYDIVLRNSKNVTNIKRVNNKFINYGPDKYFVESRSNQKIIEHKIINNDKERFKGGKNFKNNARSAYNTDNPKSANNDAPNNRGTKYSDHGNNKQNNFKNQGRYNTPGSNTEYRGGRVSSNYNQKGNTSYKDKRYNKADNRTQSEKNRYNSNSGNQNTNERRYNGAHKNQYQNRSDKANNPNGRNATSQKQRQQNAPVYQNNYKNGANKNNNSQYRKSRGNYKNNNFFNKETKQTYSTKINEPSGKGNNFKSGNTYKPKPQSMPVKNKSAFSRK